MTMAIRQNQPAASALLATDNTNPQPGEITTAQLPYIAALLQEGGMQWTNPVGVTGPTIITYFYSDDAFDQKMSDGSLEFFPSVPWTEPAMVAHRLALNAIEAVANVKFVKATSASEANLVQYVATSASLISAGHFIEQPAPGGIGPPVKVASQAFQQFPDYGTSNPGVFNESVFSSDLGTGTSSQETIVHEILHGIGLSHVHDGATFPGVTKSGDLGSFFLNQTPYTIMSYNDSQVPAGGLSAFADILFGTNVDLNGFAHGPSAFDVAALQLLYGPVEKDAGDSTIDLLTDNPGLAWHTIWDTGGDDTITNQDGTDAAVIDLRPATLDESETGGGKLSYLLVNNVVSGKPTAFGGFTIAHGVDIENAIGGTQNDILTGNQLFNTLAGSGGDDRLMGLGGYDLIVGGADSDTAVFLKDVSYYTFDFSVINLLPDGSPATQSDSPVVITYGGPTTGVGNIDEGIDTVFQVEKFDFNGTIFTYEQLHLVDPIRKVFDFVEGGAIERALGIHLGAPVAPAARAFAAPIANAAPLAAGLPALTELPIIGNDLQSAINKVQGEIQFFREVEQKIYDAIAAVSDASGTAAAGLAFAINEIPDAAKYTLSATSEGAIVHLFITADGGKQFTFEDLGIDIGDARFGLQANVNVAVDLGAHLDLAVDINVDTGQVAIAGPATAGAEELTLGLTAAVSAPSDIAAQAKLGFLNITAADTILDRPEVNFLFTLDLPEAPVETLELNQIVLGLKGSADLGLHLVTSTGADLLPTIAGDFNVHWGVGTSDPLDADGLGARIAFDDVTVDFSSFLDLMAETFRPIKDKLLDSFPIGTIIDVATSPFPIIDPLSRKIGVLDALDIIPLDPGDGTLNLMDVVAWYARSLGQSDTGPIIGGISDVAKALAGLESMLGRNPNAGDLGVIELGSYTLFDNTVPDTPPPTPAAGLRAPAQVAPAAAPDANGITHQAPGAAPLDQIAQKIRDFGLFNEPTQGTGGLSNFGDSPLKSGFRDQTGLSLPLFNDVANDPTAVVKLLFGGLFGNAPVDIIVYDFPALRFGATYEQFFPIIGPLGARLFGGFDGFIDIQVGYDTYGLQQGLSRFADGFYFSTQPFTEGSTTREPLAHLEAVVQASAAIEAALISAGVGGGIRGTINAYLNSGPDGKLRLGEILDQGIECIITPVDGKITAELFGEIKIGRDPFSWSRHITVADVTLLDFSFGCHGPDDPANRGLATLGPDTGVDAGVLRLNVGALAGLREFAPEVLPAAAAEYRKDIDEHYGIRNALDANGVVIAGALEVGAFTVTEVFGDAANAPGIITGHFGNDNDSLVIAADVTVSADISGGDGDDVLIGGAGNDTLAGNNDSDVLTGGAGDDTLLGGDGDDLLDGGKGADAIDGGAGRDQVSYEASDAGVIFISTGGKTFTGTGGDAEGDTLREIEYLIGSRFGDRLLGDPGDSNILEGIGGNDLLIGGSKDDFLIGGAGADTIRGGRGDNNGNDSTTYVTSMAGVRVKLTDGVRGSGGDAEGDRLYSIENVHGSQFDDVLTGNASRNEIEGWSGNDILSGGAGRDIVSGGEGDDTVYGGADGDTLDGGAGRDLLSYRRVAGPVTVNLRTGDGAGSDSIAFATYLPAPTDTVPDPAPVVIAGYSSFENLDGTDAGSGDSLTGDNGSNRIRGFAGNDTIDGGAGDDTLMGGAGADTLIGGAGIADWADYSASGGQVNVRLEPASPGAANGALNDAEGDRLTGIENLRGSDFKDQLSGDEGSNVIDPGLSRGPNNPSNNFAFDLVLGRPFRIVGGPNNPDQVDTLRLDYSRGDYGKGMEGGFAAGETTFGVFSREERATTTLLDEVRFIGIDRLDVYGTIQGDTIYGGGGSDLIVTGNGDDIVYTGGKAALALVYDPFDVEAPPTLQRVATAVGGDRVYAGDGNDSVFHGTNENRQLADDIDSSQMAAPFLLDGGRGVDTLAISLTGRTDNISLVGISGDTERSVTNMTLADGSAVLNFERITTVWTGDGNDYLAQAGIVDNDFRTGRGLDFIAPGLGNDVVDGGTETRVIFDADGNFTDFNIGANPGDLLYLDFSSLEGPDGVHGDAFRVSSVLSSSSLPGLQGLQVNAGEYTSASGTLEYTEIERIVAIGSNQDDRLVGTDQLVRDPGFTSGVSSISPLRGSDMLSGRGGNDTLIAGSGSDLLDGGDGDDVLIGSNTNQWMSFNHEGFETPDPTEIDTLIGGAGADTFVLGTSRGFYYGSSSASISLHGLPLEVDPSQSNRAIITDFNPLDGDKIVLYGSASDYFTFPPGTFPGQTATQIWFAGPFEQSFLIGDVQNVTSLDLTADYITYVNESTPAALRQADAAAPTSAFAAPAAALTSVAPLAGIAPAVPTVVAVPWVKQEANPDILLTTLFAGNSETFGLVTHSLVLEGNADAFGTFSGDPFGLGTGLVISTGKVTDLAGPNTLDGGIGNTRSLDLAFTRIGRVGDQPGLNGSDVLFADLSNLNFDLRTLTIGDANTRQGGGDGIVSGFDIDAVILSHTRLTPEQINNATDLNDRSFLPRLNVFDFSPAGTVWTPGEQYGTAGTTYGDLEGTKNGLVLDIANFETVRSLTKNDQNFTLGAGGVVQFELNEAVSTAGPLYLYVMEAGGAGETLTGSLRASSSRLETPADMSTDFGLRGVEDDTATMTYTFAKVAGSTDNMVAFDFVMFTEELAEFAGRGFNDSVRILLNGVNLATLNDGASLTVNNLQGSMFGPFSPDLVSNRAANGPARDLTRADAFTKTLTFAGALQDGENTLTIEVKDVADGFLDSGVLVKAGTFRAGTSTSGSAGVTVTVNAPEIVEEGKGGGIVTVTLDPGLGGLDATVTVILTPENPAIDLGNGPGQPVTVTIRPGGPLTVDVPISAGDNHVIELEHYGVIAVTTASSDPSLDGLPVAPVVVTIIDPTNRAPDIHTAPIDWVANPGGLPDKVTALVYAENGRAVVTMATATDPDGDTLTWRMLGDDPSLFDLRLNPASGVYELHFRSAPDFERPGDLGHDNIYSVILRADDRADFSGLFDDVRVDITVRDINEAPSAVGDTYTTREDTPLIVNGPGVLANDTDPDAHATLTATIVSGPAHGTLSLNADGSFAYAPDANYFGSDGFTYRAGDGALTSEVTNVGLTMTPVNDAPVAVDDNGNALAGAPIIEDRSVTFTASQLMANDFDIDPGETALLKIVAVGNPAHGTLTTTANPNGSIASITFRPAQDYNGPAEFAYTVADTAGDTDTAIVSFAIAPVNDVPVITSGRGADTLTVHVDKDMLDEARGDHHDGHGHDEHDRDEHGHNGHGHGDHDGRGRDERGQGRHDCDEHGHDDAGRGYITTIVARDVDGDALTFSLSGRDARLFTIGQDGVLSLRANLDIDETKSYLVNVKVADPTGTSDTQSLKIVFEDESKMTGSRSAVDTFVFADDFGGKIKSFTVGQDLLELHGTGYDDLQAMLDAHAITTRQVGRDTVLSVDAIDDNGGEHDHDGPLLLVGVTGNLIQTDSIVVI